MKADYILRADLLDIIFENRNKEYGAYPLRKYYDARLYKALGIIFFFMAFLSVYSLLHKHKVFNGLVYEDIRSVSLPVPEPNKPKAVEPPKNPPTPVRADVLPGILIADSLQKIDSTTNPDRLIIDSGTRTGIETGPGTIFKVGGGPGSGGDGPKEMSPVSKPVDRNIPVSDVEIMPSYPGGMQALTRFMERNLRNPRDLEEGEMISVRIRFIVGYDGMLKGFEIVQDGGEAFNNEVMRVLKKMPEWIPGKIKGENVSVRYTIPVKFVAME